MYNSNSKTGDPKNGIFRIELFPKDSRLPVFIAGTFTDPPWQLLKMERVELKGSGECKFEIRLDIAKGQDYQYKFRLGEGKHWDLNEEEPIVEDEAGNRNNLLCTQINKNGWKEKVTSDQGEEVLEERVLTKFTAEERKKTRVASQTHVYKDQPLETAHLTPTTDPTNTRLKGKNELDHNGKQHVQKLTGHRTDDLRKFISDIKVTETGILVPEVPTEPSPTPAADMDRYHELSELNLDVLRQTNNLSTNSKIDPEGSSRESSELQKNQECELDEKSASKLTQQQIRNLNIANTAAEVADMAATLDQEPPTPPVSDTEAGQIGLRRLSSTPIPEVARVAAEVADVAATLDDELLTGKTPRQLLDEEAERLFGSGHTTPIEERVPRFSHEFPLFTNPSGPRLSQSEKIFIPSLPKRVEVPDDLDLNHPSIEVFPTDPALILAKIREIQKRLPEDEARFEGVPMSPVIPTEQWSFKNVFETQSPNSFTNQPTKSLHPITEEDDSKSEDPLSEVSSIKGKERNSGKKRILETNGREQETFETDDRPNGRNGENEKNDSKRPDSRSNIDSEKNESPTQSRSMTSSVCDLDSPISPLVTQFYISDNDDASRLNTKQGDKPGSDISKTSACLSTSEDEPDPALRKIDNNSQAKSTGVSSARALSSTIRGSNSCQELKSGDQIIPPKTLYKSPKDIQSRSLLDLIWHLLLLDWLFSIVKRFWGTKKHDT